MTGAGILSRKADEETLEILHALDVEKQPRRDVMAKFGRSNSAISGLQHRMREAAMVPCECKKAKNKDCGMPEKWWSK
jgi:hypothetical protein